MRSAGIVEAHVPERRQQVRPDDQAIVTQRRRLAIQVMLDVPPQYSLQASAKGRARADHPGQDAGARLL